MSDWTDHEYKNLLGIYQDEEVYGPIETVGAPSILNKKKLKIENYNLTVDWREITNSPV